MTRPEGVDVKSVKPYLATASILVVMMAFQNCGQSSALNGNFSAATDNSSFNKINADEFSSVVIPDPINAKSLDVDVMSGQVREYTENGISTGQRFCLSEEKRAALEAALKSAEVCEPVVQPEGSQCMMIYRYPYAQLKNASVTMSLGEKHHGCEIPVNLCGEKAAEFEGLVAQLLNEIPSSSCE